jgi:hypothetical protein
VGQRLILWKPSFHFPAPDARSLVILELDATKLREKFPDLAKALGRGRVLSHTYESGLFTFLVED